MGSPAAGPLLHTLSRSQLEMVLLNCGLIRSGRKEQLAQRLCAALEDTPPLRPESRVLSIDLGLRNLAFALLTPSIDARRLKGCTDVANANLPKLQAWHRLSLIPEQSTSTGVKRAAGNEPTNEDQPSALDLSPASISDLALRLVQQQLLPLRPTHILVESQRFRTANMPGVLEWTLRVNILEAMLYAIFKTLRALGQWDGEIVGVAPRGVSAFFGVGAGASRPSGEQKDAPCNGLETDKPPESPGARTSDRPRSVASGEIKGPRDVKKQKINLVGSWLQEGTAVRLDNRDVETVADVFLNTLNPLKARRDKNLPKEKKLDDLSDSLLQGLAWLQWQQNLGLLQNGDFNMVIPGDGGKESRRL